MTTGAMKTKTILLLLSSVLLAACDTATVYTGFRPTPENGWDKDSVLTWSFAVSDTAVPYDILLHIRHTERYQYQNMWLFLNGDRDTIEFYLADDRGLWLGNRGNGTISMPVLYEHDYRFAHPGMHTLSLRHGMRQEQLRGVTGVGLEIRKSEYRHGKE